MTTIEQKPKTDLTERPPVVAVMGHIDHGKSTLLDFIRQTNTTDIEAGGITQSIGAYEASYETKDGKKKKITFIDTPGHAAFLGIRQRGAKAADLAILVVSAEEGVKPQTLEAYKCITDEEIPLIIALNKIDRPNADPERAIASLLEKGIYPEGRGGNIPLVSISAKTGQGVDELLELIILTAELEELKCYPLVNATGIIIESAVDKRKGVLATVIVQDGTLKSGEFIVAGPAIAPLRVIENLQGKKVDEISCGRPSRVTGWSELPPVGSIFKVFPTKKAAEEYMSGLKKPGAPTAPITPEDDKIILTVIIKADTAGSLEAISHELEKIRNDKVSAKVLSAGIGEITEGDIKLSHTKAGTPVLGFNVKVDPVAKNLAERTGVTIQAFLIIYKLTEWLEQAVTNLTPVEVVVKTLGKARILKLFSKIKDKQILGGKVEEGVIKVGKMVNIIRRDNAIGTGKIREPQQQKLKTSEVESGREFGALVESKIEIVTGDIIECTES